MQGVMQHHEEIVEYFKTRGVSAIFLFRRNLLRRMISILANSYDREVKPLNGTHKSHVHSPREVTSTLPPTSPSLRFLSVISYSKWWFQAEILAKYKPLINTTLLISNLKQVEDTTAKALEYFKSTRHTILYYEDVVKNHTVNWSFWTFCLELPTIGQRPYMQVQLYTVTRKGSKQKQ